MKWIDSKHIVPNDGQEVLIRVRDQFHLAIFEKREDCFRLRDESTMKVCDHDIFWAEIAAAPKR